MWKKTKKIVVPYIRKKLTKRDPVKQIQNNEESFKSTREALCNHILSYKKPKEYFMLLKG